VERVVTTGRQFRRRAGRRKLPVTRALPAKISPLLPVAAAPSDTTSPDDVARPAANDRGSGLELDPAALPGPPRRSASGAGSTARGRALGRASARRPAPSRATAPRRIC
jgi:hypothetical protein